MNIEHTFYYKIRNVDDFEPNDWLVTGETPAGEILWLEPKELAFAKALWVNEVTGDVLFFLMDLRKVWIQSSDLEYVSTDNWFLNKFIVC